MSRLADYGPLIGLLILFVGLFWFAKRGKPTARQPKHWFGTANPERMYVQHWEMMVRHGGNPFTACGELGLEPYDETGPNWCFDRLGSTRTPMDNGRIICIGGEHEDYYDSDFCIYNDVIVLKLDKDQSTITLESGAVEIYGFAEKVFPPTDFHTATLVDDRIFVIGRLGYMGTRSPTLTPVFTLDTNTYRIERVSTWGVAPGWIYGHHASYDRSLRAITVRGGKIFVPDAKDEPPNFAAHRLHLADMRWEMLSAREMHRRFVIGRSAGSACMLTEPGPEVFQPASVPHLWLPPEDRSVSRYHLSVQGVRVTFEVFSDIRVLVEGDLAPDLTEQLLAEIVENLALATSSPWTVQEVSLDRKDVDSL